MLVLCFVAGCTPKPVLVITVGGLGFSQMGNVRRAIEKQCPDADVKSAGAFDAFKSDLPKMLRESRHEHYVFIGHSLGCQTIAQAAEKVSKVDVMVFIDPAWDDIRLPKNVKRCLWYQRSNFDLVRQARIIGGTRIKIDGGHNDIPNSPELIGGVVRAINEIEVKGRKK